MCGEEEGRSEEEEREVDMSTSRTRPHTKKTTQHKQTKSNTQAHTQVSDCVLFRCACVCLYFGSGFVNAAFLCDCCTRVFCVFFFSCVSLLKSGCTLSAHPLCSCDCLLCVVLVPSSCTPIVISCCSEKAGSVVDGCVGCIMLSVCCCTIFSVMFL